MRWSLLHEPCFFEAFEILDVLEDAADRAEEAARIVESTYVGPA